MGEWTSCDSFFGGEVFLLIILLSAEWPKTSCIGKRRKRGKRKKKRKRKKEDRKRKKREEKKKRKKGGQTEIKKQKTRVVSSDSVYCKSLNFPWNFSSAAWLIICFSPVGLAGPLGEGPAVLIFRC